MVVLAARTLDNRLVARRWLLRSARRRAGEPLRRRMCLNSPSIVFSQSVLVLAFSSTRVTLPNAVRGSLAEH
jgi:hypothetical protein